MMMPINVVIDQVYPMEPDIAIQRETNISAGPRPFATVSHSKRSQHSNTPPKTEKGSRAFHMAAHEPLVNGVNRLAIVDLSSSKQFGDEHLSQVHRTKVHKKPSKTADSDGLRGITPSRRSILIPSPLSICPCIRFAGLTRKRLVDSRKIFRSAREFAGTHFGRERVMRLSSWFICSARSRSE